MTQNQIQDEPRERPPAAATTINNESIIANQVGVVHGDQNIYQVSREASPKEKFIRGVNCLNGGMTRQAEAYIHEAAVEGHRSAEVSYYWTLAILSGKSFNHLKKEEVDKLHDAFEGAARYPSDEWTAPLGFLVRLVTYLRSQEDSADPDFTELTSIFSAYTNLKRARKAEIQRHIEVMLAEAVQGHVELLHTIDASKRRMQNKRRRRAWKFFEPDPSEPQKRTSQPPQIRYHHWIRLGTGSLLGLVGVIREVLLLFDRAPVHGTVVMTALSASAYVIVKYSLDQFTLRHRQNINERERLTFLRDSGALGPARTDNPTRDAKATNRAQFMDSVASLITYYFKKHRPQETDHTTWENYTLGIRRDLQFQLTKLYQASDTDPSGLKWLIRCHAKCIENGWNSAKSKATQGRWLPDSRRLLRGASVTVVIASTLVVLAICASADLTGAIFATLLIVVGCVLALPGAMHAYGEVRRHANETQEYERLYRAERKEYERWLSVLEDRPSDLEMARWLDYDKTHIKSVAMEKHQVTGRDIIAHTTLTESNPQHKHARVPFGPFRYSRYEVHVFLLTEGGVRQMSVDLDFRTGELSNYRRRTFRYDSIASAGIVEVQVSFYGRQRSVKTSDDPVEIRSEKKPSSVVTTQALRLSLVDGDKIDILFEGFDEAALNPLNDTEDLREWSQDASGATGALRILETVAAEGKEWLERERARRHRRLADFSTGHAATDVMKHSGSTVMPRRKNNKKPPTQLAVGGDRRRQKKAGRKPIVGGPG